MNNKLFNTLLIMMLLSSCTSPAIVESGTPAQELPETFSAYSKLSFDRKNTNSDEVLSEKEYFENDNDTVIQDMSKPEFEMADVNNDGKLTLEEYTESERKRVLSNPCEDIDIICNLAKDTK